jgi:hypothetical protein
MAQIPILATRGALPARGLRLYQSWNDTMVASFNGTKLGAHQAAARDRAPALAATCSQ